MTASQYLTKTTLIHGSLPPGANRLLSAVIYEYSGLVCASQIQALTSDYLDHAQGLGVDAVLIRPALVDFSDPHESAVLQAFVDRAHNLGLMVVFRLSGAFNNGDSCEDPFTGLENINGSFLKRAKICVQLGVDGLDFGKFVEDSQTFGVADHHEFAQLLRTIESYGAGQGRELPLSLLVSHKDSRLRSEQATENWIHILRDDHMFFTPWNVEEIINSVINSTKDLISSATTAGWQVSPNYRMLNDSDKSSWYATAKNHHRRTAAMTMLAMSLPGSFILRQGDEIGLPEHLRTDAVEIAKEIDHLLDVNRQRSKQQVTWSTDHGVVVTSAIRQLDTVSDHSDPLLHCASFFVHTQKLLAKRKELGLGKGSLAVVSFSKIPSENKAILSGKTLVMFNTCDVPLLLPDYIHPLLISDRKVENKDLKMLPPDCTIWCGIDNPCIAERLRKNEPRF